MLRIDRLREMGVDVRNGVDRCYGKEAFYLTLVDKMLADGKFDAVAAAWETGDRESMLNMARALLETSGNLSLTPLMNAIAALCARLESGACASEVGASMRGVLAVRDRLREADGQ